MDNVTGVVLLWDEFEAGSRGAVFRENKVIREGATEFERLITSGVVDLERLNNFLVFGFEYFEAFFFFFRSVDTVVHTLSVGVVDGFSDF